jgi:hypothetical protein
MNRVLLSIGCDKYDNLNPLSGAENDAVGIYEILTNSEFGGYSRALSQFILSPTLNDIRDCLRRALFEGGKIDTFTFFFAGHGGVVSGNYYLCPKDADSRMYSVSAFRLSDLFSLLNEAKPRQSNIILDACQAGGVVSDLHALLRPELLGGANTPGITIFSSSASDQYSSGTPIGGYATLSLMRGIRGETLVQTNRPTLDLLELGRTVSALMMRERPEQIFVLWGLNLYGEAGFCKNRNFRGHDEPVLSLPRLAPGSAQYEAIQELSDDLWREYYFIDSDFDPSRFGRRLSPILHRLAKNSDDVAEFARGVANTFALRAEKSDDLFRPAEVFAASSILLLEHESVGKEVSKVIDELCGKAIRAALEALENTYDLMHRGVEALINDGMSDLFYLPLRISKLLGWMSLPVFIDTPDGIQARYQVVRKQIMAKLLEKYSGSIVAMSDAQAPFLLVYLMGAKKLGDIEEAETVAGLMFTSFVTCRGMIASANIDPEDVPEYLHHRDVDAFQDAYDMIANPSELLPVLLMASAKFGNEESFDLHLSNLDHAAFNVFVPYSYRDFGKSTIDGVNHTFQIGHGVWRVEEFIRDWQERCSTQMKEDASLSSQTVRAAAILATLLFPDRTPWFICTDG